MSKRHIESAAQSKRQLLNASQRKYLNDRISRHYWKLEREVEKQEEAKEPPEIVVARKLIDDWEEANEKREKSEIAKRQRALKYRVDNLTESLLFDDTETALAKVASFEATTWEEYVVPPGTARSGSPDWDKE